MILKQVVFPVQEGSLCRYKELLCVTASFCSPFCVTASSCSPYNGSGTIFSNVVVFGSKRQSSISRLSWVQYTMVRAVYTVDFKPKSYVDQTDKF